MRLTVVDANDNNNYYRQIKYNILLDMSILIIKKSNNLGLGRVRDK